MAPHPESGRLRPTGFIGVLSSATALSLFLCIGGPAQSQTIDGTLGSALGGTSNGGAAALPDTQAGIEQRRLRSTRGEEDEGGAPPAGDSVATFASGVSIFLSGEYRSLDRGFSGFQAAYDSSFYRLTAGADYRIGETGIVGLAFDFWNQQGDFGTGGGFNNNAYGVIGFGGWSPSKNTFVQGVFEYHRLAQDYSRLATFDPITFGRPVSAFASADYPGNEFRIGGLAGYTYDYGRAALTPRLGLDYRRISYGGYSESGGDGILNLRFQDQVYNLFQSRLGAAGSYTIPSAHATVVPYVSMDWLHEYANGQQTLSFNFVNNIAAPFPAIANTTQFAYQTQRPDRDWFELNAGVVATFGGGRQAFVNYQTLLGLNYYDSHAVTIGVRFPL